jgi:hypothetical protein
MDSSGVCETTLPKDLGEVLLFAWTLGIAASTLRDYRGMQPCLDLRAPVARVCCDCPATRPVTAVQQHSRSKFVLPKVMLENAFCCASPVAADWDSTVCFFFGRS